MSRKSDVDDLINRIVIELNHAELVSNPRYNIMEARRLLNNDLKSAIAAYVKFAVASAIASEVFEHEDNPPERRRAKGEYIAE